MLKTLVNKQAMAGLWALLLLGIIHSSPALQPTGTPAHRESPRGPGFALESFLLVPPGWLWWVALPNLLTYCYPYVKVLVFTFPFLRESLVI